jgi:DNA mismatch endonuclease (patch repair protein)|tara:strand:+ start:777 stop:1193 length:417 start_codon:yes stop_codon:yes gene_type:complete
MDIISKERRSWNMSRIKGLNTKPELYVRSFLHRNGFRFRLNRKDLSGSPDIVLPKYTTVVFIDGCFWHRHIGCKFSYTPKSNTSFWEKKFSNNIKRDVQVNMELVKAGWKVIRIWECEILDINRKVRDLGFVLEKIGK